MTDAGAIFLAGISAAVISGAFGVLTLKVNAKIKADERRADEDRAERRRVAELAESATRAVAHAAAVADRKVDAVAETAREVRTELAVSTDQVAAKLAQMDARHVDHEMMAARLATLAESTHVLVNSQYEAQLRLTATSARALAEATKKAEHMALAETAERLLADHVRRQAAADHRGSTP